MSSWPSQLRLGIDLYSSIRVEVRIPFGVLNFFPIFPNFKGKYLLSAMFRDIQILNINKVGSKLPLQGGKSHVVLCGLLLFLYAKIGIFRQRILKILPFFAFHLPRISNNLTFDA